MPPKLMQNASARIRYIIIARRHDNGCGFPSVATRQRLSAALISPFARARLPQSHHLRLSVRCVDRVTTLNHRFENDYSQLERICQAFGEKYFPNIQNPYAARMFGKSEVLRKCDRATFVYELFMRQNIIDLCYFQMKLPKTLDRFRRYCYNNPCCREKKAETRSLKTIQRERQGKL